VRPAVRAVAVGALSGLALLFIAPLLWMVSTSLKTDAQAISAHPALLPAPATVEGYGAILHAPDQPVLRWFLNSVLAAAAQSALVVSTSALAAYGLARLPLKGRKALFAMLMGTLLIPPITFLAPQFVLVARLGWVDTRWAVVVPGAAGAFGVFFLRQFFVSLPRELEEAARLDGAGPWRVFWHVVLPLSRPGGAAPPPRNIQTKNKQKRIPPFV
jgi:multiple sugar transport system permease protein